MTEKILRCMVVDDEPLASALITGYVRRTPFLELVAEVNTADEAMKAAAMTHPDLVFLDIHMPGKDGLTLARELGPDVKVVFTTAYADHALESFGVGAVHYLLKPVSYSGFLEAALRVYYTLPSQTPAPEYIMVKSEYRLIRIPLSEILYIEGLKDYVRIVLDSSEQPVMSLMSMRAVENAVEGARFMRVHRSFIVNLDKVRIIERNTIILGGRAIPVTPTMRPALNKALS